LQAKESIIQTPSLDSDGFKSKIKFYLMTSKFVQAKTFAKDNFSILIDKATDK
jgi:hypothetical protein